jgi:hypothetical protein
MQPGSFVSIGNSMMLMGAEPNEILEAAKELADAVARGFKVERCTLTEARKSPFGCKICRSKN